MTPNPSVDLSPFKRLKETAAFFRVYGKDLARSFLILYLPVVVVSLLPPEAFPGLDADSGGIAVVPLIFNFFYQPIYTGALIYQLTRIEAGAPWSLKEGFIVGVRLWDKLLLVSLVSLGFTVAGLMLFIVPGLIAFARLSLAEYLVVIDHHSPRAALRSSFTLTRPYTLAIVGSATLLFGAFLFLQVVVDQLARTLSLHVIWPIALNALLSVVLVINMTILLFRFYGLATRRPSDASPLPTA